MLHRFYPTTHHLQRPKNDIDMILRFVGNLEKPVLVLSTYKTTVEETFTVYYRKHLSITEDNVLFGFQYYLINLDFDQTLFILVV